MQVTCNDRAPADIHRALEHHLLMEEEPEDYELGQIISQQHSKWDNQMVGSHVEEVHSGQLVAQKSRI